MRWGARLGWAILGLLLAGWAASWLSGYDVVADVDPTRAGLPPGGGHWLGTDHMGRDVFWRLVLASRAFVGPGRHAHQQGHGAGEQPGAVAGYLGGGPAGVLRYGFAVIHAVPRFVLVLLAGAIYGAEPVVLAVAAGVSYAPTLGESVHARIESLRNADFVDAARAHGLSPAAILGRHLLWVNCRRLVGRHLLFAFAFYLLLETTLSFLGGFGVEEPDPSWGNMLAFEFGIPDGNPWAWIAPALAIWMTIGGTLLASEALAERADG